MSVTQATPDSTQLIDLLAARRFASTGEAHEIRTACGLSLADVAAAIGSTPATVSRWERQESVPYGPPARRYARLLAELREHLNHVRPAVDMTSETPNPAGQPGSEEVGRAGDRPPA